MFYYNIKSSITCQECKFMCLLLLRFFSIESISMIGLVLQSPKFCRWRPLCARYSSDNNQHSIPHFPLHTGNVHFSDLPSPLSVEAQCLAWKIADPLKCQWKLYQQNKRKCSLSHRHIKAESIPFHKFALVGVFFLAKKSPKTLGFQGLLLWSVRCQLSLRDTVTMNGCLLNVLWP